LTGSAASGRLPERAGLARRFAALVYEALLVAAIVLVAGFALVPFVSPEASRDHALAAPSLRGRVVSFVALFALFAAYFGWSWSEGRRTLPMKAWRLGLVTRDGARVPRALALGRYLAWWIGPALGLAAYALAAPPGLGVLSVPLFLVNYLAAFADPERQFLHDRVAGTRVVTSPPAPRDAPPAAPAPPRTR
jgi:uncharacterized RDD family membrane protein YckC